MVKRLYSLEIYSNTNVSKRNSTPDLNDFLMSLSVFQSICKRVSESFPADLWRQLDVAVAVSGGPDSIVLLRAVTELRASAGHSGKLFVVHCNHQTRPECNDEQQFVQQLCEQLKVEFHVLQKQEATASQGVSEEDLRDWRYHSQLKLAQKLGVRYLLTGHHQDDQVETILFRLIRGTGLAGLQGIPKFRVHQSVTIVRPLLQVQKSEIEQALIELDQPVLRDASNEESKFSRNFIRNEVLPVVRERFGNSIDHSLSRISDQASELTAFLDEQAAHLAGSAIKHQSEKQLTFSVTSCESEPAIIVRHLLKTAWRDAGWPEQDMTQAWWNILCKLAQGTSTETQNLPGNVIARRDDADLLLSRA